MTDTELLQALSNMIDTKLVPIKNDLNLVKQDIDSVKQDIDSVKQDIDSVKRTTNHLRKEMIKMQAMDEAILDEVERVHDILEKHIKDTTKHTA